MALSLRTRLTAWYSVLLVLTVAVFSAAVLWLHWRLLLEQFDEGLTSIGATAANVVEEELGELHDLGLAAAEMAAVVPPRGLRGPGARRVRLAASEGVAAPAAARGRPIARVHESHTDAGRGGRS